MSKPARITAVVLFYIVSVIYAYGMGHKHGRTAQLSLDQVIEICEAQFFHAIKQRRK